MFKFPQLNFPPYRLRTTLRGRDSYVWDPQRGCWLLLTPEEWVRQNTIRFLFELGAPQGCLAQEYPVNFGDGLTQRADIVVFDKDMTPVMLVECKAAGVAISNEVLSQAVRYNSIICATYILLTNGLKHYCYRRQQDGSYAHVDKIPEF